MRHSFSSEFMKIVPPATNFGEAWENLCLCLLRVETADNSVMRIGPPDRGIDIYRQHRRMAYQCKSSERGIFGTIDPNDCIDSLTRAVAAKKEIAWDHYSIALNAPLSGIGFSKIIESAKSQGLPENALSILPAEYWDELCERHTATIQSLFDYRVFISEAQVIEALRKARYYDSFVQQAVLQIKAAPLTLAVKNNRAPVELTLPFSGEFTVKQLLDVVRGLLGISLDWANFPDLGTSCGPSLSMAVDRVPLSFDRKLSELTIEEKAKLQLWIKLVWRDELQTEDNYDGNQVFFKLSIPTPTQVSEAPLDRGKTTVNRMEAIVQTTIWKAVQRIQ